MHGQQNIKKSTSIYIYIYIYRRYLEQACFDFVLVPFIFQEYENRSLLRSDTARTLMMHINGITFMKLRSLNSDIRSPNHASHFCIQFTQA